MGIRYRSHRLCVDDCDIGIRRSVGQESPTHARDGADGNYCGYCGRVLHPADRLLEPRCGAPRHEPRSMDAARDLHSERARYCAVLHPA